MASELTAEEEMSLAQYKEHVGNPRAKGGDILFRVGSYEEMRATVRATSARNMLHSPAYNFRPGELMQGVPEMWIGADVVDYFVYIMNQKAAEDGKKAFYLFTDAWAAFEENNFAMGRLCRDGISDLDDLFVPIPSRGHYTLIHVRLKEGAAWWYDSLDAGDIGEDKRKGAEKILRRYFAHHAEADNSRCEKSLNVRLMRGAGPQQGDGVNCAIHVIVRMICLYLSDSTVIKKVNRRTMPLYRDRLMAAMVKDKVHHDGL